MTQIDLIKEAKERYPVGTVYMPAHLKDPKITDTIEKDDEFDYFCNQKDQICIKGRDTRQGNWCSLLYYLGAWAEIVSKPEVKTQFIVGKWYTGFANSPESLGKLTSKVESTERFPSTEYISPDKRYCKGSYFTGFHNNIVEANMEEVSKYLPEGHPDKLPKSKETKLKVGEWYRYEHSKTDHYIFKITKIDGGNIYCDKYYAFGSVTKPTAHMAYIQDEERFFSISMDEVYKYFPEERPKEEKITKLDPDKFYWVDWGYTKEQYLLKGHTISLGLNTNKFNMNGNFNYPNYWTSIRLATKDEQEWLEKCIVARKFIPKEEALKPVIMEKENLVGRYLKIIRNPYASSEHTSPGDYLLITSETVSNIDTINVKTNGTDYWIKTRIVGIEDGNNFELMPIGWTPEAKTPITAMNTYGLKVGDKLPATILNNWMGCGLNAWDNYYSKGWEKGQGMHSGDRTINKFDIKGDIPAFQPSGSGAWVRAEGFKEFMENFNKPKVAELSPLPDKWCIIGNRQEIADYCTKYGVSPPYGMSNNYCHFPAYNNCTTSSKIYPGYTEITFDQFKKWVLVENKSKEEIVPEYVECIKRGTGYLAEGAIVKCKIIDGVFKWLYEKDTKYNGYFPEKSIGNWDSYQETYKYTIGERKCFKPSTKEAYNRQNLKSEVKMADKQEDKWCIFVTEENKKELLEYFHSIGHEYKGYTKFWNFHVGNTVHYPQPETNLWAKSGKTAADGYRFITMEEFYQKTGRLISYTGPSLKEEEFKVGDWVVITTLESKSKGKMQGKVGHVYQIDKIDSYGYCIATKETYILGSCWPKDCIRKALPHEIPDKLGFAGDIVSKYTFGEITSLKEPLYTPSVKIDSDVFNLKMPKSASVTLKNTEREVKINVKQKQSIQLNK